MNTQKPTHVLIRLSQTEKTKLQELAKEHHLSMTSFIKLKTLTTKY
jgi:hypothetical protein